MTAAKIVEGVHMPDLEIESSSIETAVAYRFVFPRGWAIFTVNDATGEFNTQSDWGNYSYRWSPSPSNLGAPTLTDFLRRTCLRDPSYIIEKLSYGNKTDLANVVDEDATRKSLKRELAQQYRYGNTTRYYYLAALAEIVDDLVIESKESIGTTMAECYCLNLIVPDWFECVEEKRSTRYLILCHALLPFFGRFLEQGADAKKGGE